MSWMERLWGLQLFGEDGRNTDAQWVLQIGSLVADAIQQLKVLQNLVVQRCLAWWDEKFLRVQG